MSITIQPYRLPQPDDLPESVASWRPDSARAALLIHDMQQYFMDFYDPADEPRRTLVAHVVALRDQAIEQDLPLFYTAQPGSMSKQDRGLLADVWGPGMRAVPEDRAIIDELAPRTRDAVLTKWRYSAFFRTDLLQRLRAAGRDQLIVCGVYAHVGCLATAVDAFTHDIETFFVADALGDFGPTEHRTALTMAARTCAVTTTTARMVEDLGARVQEPR